MAYVKNRKLIEDCDQAYFDAPLKPGQHVRRTGIYRCACGFEIVCERFAMLPTMTICAAHSGVIGTDWIPPEGGIIVWRLAVLVKNRNVPAS